MANLEWFVSQFSPSQLRMYATSSDMTFGWNTLEMDFNAEENRVKLPPARRSESILSFTGTLGLSVTHPLLERKRCL